MNLARDERLVPEIAGLIVGVDFEKPMIEFFDVRNPCAASCRCIDGSISRGTWDEATASCTT